MNAATLSRLGVLACLLALPVRAHHGVAPHYDDGKQVTLDGTVAEFQFINPHSFVYLRTIGADGTETIWHCEMASRSVLARNGLTQEAFAAGAHVKITGSQARHNPTGCALREAHFDDGSVLRSSTLFGATPATTAVPDAQRESIEGVWAMKTFAVSYYTGALTDEGERLRAAFDPIKDDPAIDCEPASPVRFWVNVNEPFEIRRDGNTVVVDHQFMDSRRVVHLGETEPPPGTPRSSMGYSTGRFDGSALVIETTSFERGSTRAAPRRHAHGGSEADGAHRGQCANARARDHVDDRRSRRVQRAAHAKGSVRAHRALARAVQLQAGVSAVAARS